MKLHIGPDTQQLDGWHTLDVEGKNCDSCATWGSDALPFDDNSVDIIYASHVFEHIPWYCAAAALGEALRVLRSGGRLELWLPDLDVVLTALRTGVIPDNWRRYNEEGDVMKWVNGRLFAYDSGDGPNWHRAAYTFNAVKQCLAAAGFIDIKRLDSPRTRSHGAINMGIAGTKAGGSNGVSK